jgi:hypothetical protein
MRYDRFHTLLDTIATGKGTRFNTLGYVPKRTKMIELANHKYDNMMVSISYAASGVAGQLPIKATSVDIVTMLSASFGTFCT